MGDTFDARLQAKDGTVIEGTIPWVDRNSPSLVRYAGKFWRLSHESDGVHFFDETAASVDFVSKTRTLSPPPPLVGVLDVPLENADELLDALSHRQKRWRPDPGQWLFRGQADARWLLRPTAMRSLECFAKFGVQVAQPTEERPAWSVRVDAAEALLVTFRERLHRAGHVTPQPEPLIARVEGGGVWPSHLPQPTAYPLMALAQHYGLPTQMLDWTRRALFAAYFASLDATRALANNEAADHIAIWAMNRAALRPRDGLYYGMIKAYEAPAQSNANFHAQQGVLTVSLAEGESGIEEIPEAQGHLVRFTCPTSEAPTILRYLGEEGIDGGSLFPGIDGVVKAMVERTLWAADP